MALKGLRGSISTAAIPNNTIAIKLAFIEAFNTAFNSGFIANLKAAGIINFMRTSFYQRIRSGVNLYNPITNINNKDHLTTPINAV